MQPSSGEIPLLQYDCGVIVIGAHAVQRGGKSSEDGGVDRLHEPTNISVWSDAINEE